MKVYRGRRTESGAEVTVEDASGVKPLPPRLDLHAHSPSGFEWGYAGSGPAQLALALTADVLGDDDRARDVYQRFKFAVIGSLGGDTWTLTEAQVRKSVEDIERAQARLPDSRAEGRTQ